MLLTPAELRQLTNAAHDVADAVLESYIALAQDWAETVANALLERRAKELVCTVFRSGLQRLYIPGHAVHILEARLETQDITSLLEQVSYNAWEFDAEMGQRLYVRYEAGYAPAEVPPALKLVVAFGALYKLQEAGYARTESWLGLEQLGVTTPEGTRNLRRQEFARWFVQQIAPFSWAFPAGIL
jgi:hypothetical protein